MIIPETLKEHCEPVSSAAPNSSIWLESRRQGIGASDCPKILGLSSFGSAIDIWQAKKGTAPPSPAWVKPYQEVGHMVEAPILRHIYASLPVDPIHGAELPILKSKSYPILRASLDGFDPVANTIEEIKSDTWEDVGTVPDCHWAQAQHQMIVTGAEAVYIRHIKMPIDRPILPELVEEFIDDADVFLDWLIEKSTITSHRIDPDPEWQARWIKRAVQWWEWYVVGDREPPATEDLDGSVDLGKVNEVSAALDAYAVADRKYKAMAKDIEKEREALKKEARSIISRYARLDADAPKRVIIGNHKATACKTKGGGYYWRIYPGEVQFDIDEF